MYDDPTNLAFYVRCFPEVLPADFCREAIQHFTSGTYKWNDGRMRSDDGNEVKEQLRKCRTLNLPEENEVTKRLYDGVSDTLMAYYTYLEENKILWPRIQSAETPCMLHYRKGDFLKEHNDSGPEKPRTLTAILNLSDQHKGGFFSFFGDRIRLKLGVGEALIFPSCFTFPHAVTEIADGERYSVITWLK